MIILKKILGESCTSNTIPKELSAGKCCLKWNHYIPVSYHHDNDSRNFEKKTPLDVGIVLHHIVKVGCHIVSCNQNELSRGTLTEGEGSVQLTSSLR
jgi:hypothetical protein